VCGRYGPQVKYVHANSIKRFFDIQTGHYSSNKTEAVRLAREYVPEVKSDHEADTVLHAVYFFEKTHG